MTLLIFLGSTAPANEWAKRAMTYIGIKVRVVGQTTILDADSQGRICLRFGASTVTLPKAVLSLLEQGQIQIVLNLANVNRMEADDLRELVSTSITVKERGGQMKVVHLTPRLAEVMNEKVLPLFDVYESESQALASFRRYSAAPANSFSNAAET